MGRILEDQTAQSDRPPVKATGAARIRRRATLSNIPREIRDLVYQFALVSGRRILGYYLIGDANYAFKRCEELLTLRNILIACGAGQKVTHEACKVFITQNNICIDIDHLHNVMGFRSLPRKDGPPLSLMFWVWDITLNVWKPNPETSDPGWRGLQISLSCPKLRCLTLRIFRSDGPDALKALPPHLLTAAKVCKGLSAKLGRGLKIHQVGWIYRCESRNLT